MIGFTLFLLIVMALGCIVLATQDKRKKRRVTIPQPSEVSMQLANDWSAEVTQLPKSQPRINQVHWHIRAFERPRRKKEKQ